MELPRLPLFFFEVAERPIDTRNRCLRDRVKGAQLGVHLELFGMQRGRLDPCLHHLRQFVGHRLQRYVCTPRQGGGFLLNRIRASGQFGNGRFRLACLQRLELGQRD